MGCPEYTIVDLLKAHVELGKLLFPNYNNLKEVKGEVS